jgi:methionine synthase II (cobalamin-independent)
MIVIATGIGSLPFTDVDRALDVVFASCPEAPFWPQLPRRSFLENMYVQSLEGLPGLVIDEKNGTVYIDSRRTDGIEQFYDDVSGGNVGAFRLSEAAAPGFYRFLERLGEVIGSVRVIKGQLTGPFTCGLGMKDESGKAIIYDPGYFDIVKKMLHMRGRWMESAIRERYPDKEVLLFFDEPFMVSFGSAYVSIPKEEVVSSINEVLDGVEATTGIHCCGNTDWSVLLATRVDVVNYDAFGFPDNIFYYRQELEAFLTRGGTISPGIVPSSEAVTGATAEDMEALWKRFASSLSAALPGAADARFFVTPSCGLGSLAEADTMKALQLLKELPQIIKRKG